MTQAIARNAHYVTAQCSGTAHVITTADRADSVLTALLRDVREIYGPIMSVRYETVPYKRLSKQDQELVRDRSN